MTSELSTIDATAMPFALERRLLERMLLIRRFEERLVELFAQGRLKGTTHSYVGQEAVAVAVAEALAPDDFVISNHRGHGHFLAYGGSIEGLLREIMGRPDGVCAGRGGSQHLHQHHFFSNGITGGMAPVATGVAWSQKLKATGAVVVLFIGDGAMGHGVVYESLNIASLQSLPILFAVENNKYAMSTSVAQAAAGRLSDRGRAFAVDSFDLACEDILALRERTIEIVDGIRRTGRPAFAVFDTYRHDGHSKSDAREYRSREEEAAWRGRDALDRLVRRLPEKLVHDVRGAVEARLDACYRACLEAAQ